MALMGTFIKKSIAITAKVKELKPLKPAQKQKKVLLKLLKKASKTEFGREYNFAKIAGLKSLKNSKAIYEDFRKLVPIHDYNTIYNKWWWRARKGEKNVTWPGKVKYFALSSGTSEASSKAIPVTKSMIKAIQKASVAQIIALGHFRQLPKETFEKGYLLLGGSTHLNLVDDHFEGDLSGITVGKIPFWFEKFFKPGREISREQNWERKLKEITEKASEWDVAFVAGVPAWIQILFERIIQHYRVKDIHEIWPNLVAFGWGGVSIEPYRESFRKLLRPEKPFYFLETYLASEGFIAYQAKPNAHLQLILSNGIFYEFIPFNSNNFDDDGNLRPKTEVLMISEVKENVEYALLLTTCAGAWRYLIGDTVKFLNKKNVEIVITGRTKHFLSLCGEHLSVENMNQAIKLLAEQEKVAIKEFTVIGKSEGGLFTHEWYIGCDEAHYDQNLSLKLDEILIKLNDDYATERKHALKFVNVRILPNRTFLTWLKIGGKEGGQSKFPRVLKGAKAKDWEGFIAASGL
jgi:hypothetical protein